MPRRALFTASLALALAAAGQLTSASAAPTVQTTAASPTITNVSVQYLQPSTLQPSGAHQLVVLGRSPDQAAICSFHVTRDGDDGAVDLGRHSGRSLRFVDVLPASSIGRKVFYYMSATGCDGTTGGNGYSVIFLNEVDNDAAAPGFRSVAARTAFGGSYRTAGGLGASLTWHSFNVYNVALYAPTGPTGGIATLYVDGVKKGSVSFYSSTAKPRVLVTKYGWGQGGEHTIRLVMTKAGARGGTAMTYDAISWLFQTGGA